MSKNNKNSLTLVCLNIEGKWNIPLLQNAAEINGASLIFAPHKKVEMSSASSRTFGADEVLLDSIKGLRADFDSILACETGKRTANLFDFPRPRGRVAVVVGNEMVGISKEDLKQSDAIVSIPLQKGEITSLNVAVAAAITLFFLDKDLARRCAQNKMMLPHNMDLLLSVPNDPNEVGSLLRSVWALGWHKVYLIDPHQVWFSKDRDVILAGRSAARCEKNPIVVIPGEELCYGEYDLIINCNSNGEGSPLSKFRLPRFKKALLSFGACDIQQHLRGAITLDVDFKNSRKDPCYRHAGSIFCSYFAQYFKSRG